MTNDESDNYFDPTNGGEPYYLEEDTGYGQCPQCDSYLENWGAESSGDGSVYNVLGCPLCQEPREHVNETWYDNEGNAFDDEDEYYMLGVFDDDDDLENEKSDNLLSRLHAFLSTLPATPPERPEHGHMGETAWLIYARDEMAYDIRQELVRLFPELAEGEGE